jgi:tetratricopeptide (TPR) repeat protein
MARRYDEALAQLQKALELDGYFINTHGALSIVYQLQGNYAASVEAHAKMVEIAGDQEGARFVRESFAAGGWQGFLREMTRNSRAPEVRPLVKAAMYRNSVRRIKRWRPSTGCMKNAEPDFYG